MLSISVVKLHIKCGYYVFDCQVLMSF